MVIIKAKKNLYNKRKKNTSFKTKYIKKDQVF